MHFSKNSFLLSFAMAFALFGVIMACIGVDIFSSRVSESMVARHDGAILTGAPLEKYESYLFFCKDGAEGPLEQVIFVRVDEQEKIMLVTEAPGELVIEREGEFYYLRSIYEHFGAEDLAKAFAAVTGYEVPIQNRFLKSADFRLDEHFEEVHAYTLSDSPLITEHDGEVDIVNIGANLAAFRK